MTNVNTDIHDIHSVGVMESMNMIREAIQWLHEEETRELIEMNSDLYSKLKLKFDEEHNFIAASPVMQKIVEEAKLFSQSDDPILLVGQLGTGKTRLSKYIHAMSNRKSHLFVEVDCKDIPTQKLSTILFGVARNIHAAKPPIFGALESAQRGTLYIKNINAMAHSLQMRFADMMESNGYYNEGGTLRHPSNVRIIMHAVQTLHELKSLDLIHSRLWKSIKEKHIELPPLTNRKEELLDFIYYFLGVNRETTSLSIDPGAITQLEQYSWRGNLSELKLVLNQCMLLNDRKGISSEVVRRVLGGQIHNEPVQDTSENIEQEETPTLKALRLQHIQRVLSYVNGNRQQASEILGITTRTLTEKVKELRMM